MAVLPPFPLAQDVIVTLMAAGAAWVVVRRVLGFVRSGREKGPVCAACPSGGCASRAEAAAGPAAAVPLRLIQPGRGGA